MKNIYPFTSRILVINKSSWFYLTLSIAVFTASSFNNSTWKYKLENVANNKACTIALCPSWFLNVVVTSNNIELSSKRIGCLKKIPIPELLILKYVYSNYYIKTFCSRL